MKRTTISTTVWAFMLALCMSVQGVAQSVASKFSNIFASDESDYYDLDSDGVMEWKYSKLQKTYVYRFNSGLNDNTQIGESRGKWTNLNNDEWIDAYENGYIYIGDNTHVNAQADAYVVPNGEVINPIDYDNDGRPDFIIQESPKGNTLRQDANGQWMPGKVRVWTPEEYAGLEIKGPTSNTGSGIPGMEDMFIGSDLPPAGTFGGFNTVDLNGDGRTDFIDGANGCYYLNVGTDGLVEYSFGGQVMPRDLNGDGMSDFLLFDGDALKLYAYLTQEDGTSKLVTLMSGLYCSNKIWCYDFDKDGDVDVLIPFDYWTAGHSNGGSYLVMMENKGDGTFKRHENYIEGETYFIDCLDIDADGCYEVVGRLSNVYNSYKVNNLTINTTPEEIFLFDGVFSSSKSTEILADINNSGKTYWLCDKYMTLLSDNVNEAPTAPTAPRYVYDAAEGTLKVFWDAATDKESATLDLTYALRIGTEKDKGDILFAHAQADGTRRNLQDGNNGYSRTRTLNVSSWPAGTYYISVQAVDPNRRGSKFSEYAVFEKKNVSTGFVLSHKYYYAVGDTCTVVLQSPKETGYTYTWNWDGGTLLEQSADGTSYSITFAEGGEKHISLQVNDANGNIAGSSEQTLEVNRGNMALHKDEYIQVALDLDEDGKSEVINQYSERKIYEGDSEGNYTAVKYIYNTNLDKFLSNPIYIMDKNRDGKPDLFSYSRGNYYTDGSYFLINEGDKQMTMSDPVDLTALDDNYSGFENLWFDVDNDGDLDILNEKRKLLYINNGDYISFTEKDGLQGFYENLKDASVNFIDYNKDGIMDLRYYTTRGTASLCIFTEDGTSVNQEITLPVEKLYLASGQNIQIEDLDGDGKFDVIVDYAGGGHGFSTYGSKYHILWGGETLDSVPAPNGESFSGLHAIYDVDNNGCLDIITKVIDTDEKSHEAVIYFYPDRSWKVESVTESATFYGGGFAYYRTNRELALSGYYDAYRISGRVNEKPQAPTEIRASQGSKAVVIEWNHAKDKETPETLMRYNISIKYKGKTGEGAYFYSPLNSTKNGVYYPTGRIERLSITPVTNLLTSNQFTIPITSIAPGEYEVQVQGIDRWEEPSDFSEVFNLTVKESSLIDMPASAMTGTSIKVTILGNSEQAVSFGEDVTILHEDKANGYYRVSYETPGIKTVTVGSLDSQDIYIYPRPEGAFTLPERIMQGAKVNVDAPNATMGSWNVTWGGNSYAINNDVCSSMEIVNDSTVAIYFKQGGEYTVVHEISGSYYMASTVSDQRVTSPTITIVNTDEATGKHKVNWNTATESWMDVQSINVYKETSRYEVYELLANVPVEQGGYVDMTSMPEVQASRYRLAYVTSYGESEASTPHQSIHVMINKGVGNTWNLMWNKYEGLDVSSYRILGGSTPDALDLITEVSGNLSSYSDLKATEGVRYYAVEILPVGEAVTRAATLSSRSNVVSVDEASEVNLAEKIIITSADGETTLTDGETQLTAYIYPVSTTYQRVNWIVVKGDDIATITQDGRLKVTAGGEVTVRAYAMDGSNVYGEITLQAVDGVEVEEIVKGKVHPASVIVGDQIVIKGLPTDGQKSTLYLFDTNGRIHAVAETVEAEATLNSSTLPSGLYFVKVVLPEGTETVRVIKE